MCGSNFAVLTPDLPVEGAVLRGRYQMVRLRSGLTLHATDASDMHDLTTQLVHAEGVTISLFLDGMADVTLGDRRFLLGPAATGEIEGVMIARGEPDLFRRRGRQGMHVRKVNVSLPFDWLDGEGLEDIAGHGAVRALFSDHLSSARFRPSARLLALAEQVLRPPSHGALLNALHLESRVLEIAAEALGLLGQDPPQGAPTGLLPREQRRMWEVHDFLEARLDGEFTLEDVAREAGMSANRLQRLFRTAFGMTVFEYVRRRKLERARQALQEEGLSVSEAAYRAGYNSSANFATAFRRAFGVSPKEMRRRP
ncbi:helix-turn-helix transcriptional regulator [Aquabacter cavernae]|uniref:helix-turn-helix transcriptional regulator n=1 Tax=Aquabacter cavernae TaxID=2496029 RepID=UPI0013DF0EAA|nr:AraC family transcriptional regulator [Aquabacter cavernae]